MTHLISRRAFGIGAAMFAAASQVTGLARAQETRTITTSLGTYDIPATPRRVIAIDSRLDLEPAVALGLNIIGHAYGPPEPWVPSDPAWEFVGEQPDLEKVLALEPDLIVCTDVGNPDSEWWPINRLKTVAPVLPPSYEQSWKDILRQIGEWTGTTGAADAKLAEYDALIADIKARRGELIASRKVAIVQPVEDREVYARSVLSFLQPQVLNDLGGTTIPEHAPGEPVPAEQFGTVYGDVDAILYVTFEDGQAEKLESNPLWARLPAIANGKTLVPRGNTNYGGIYTAIRIAQLLDELYGTLA